MGVVASAMLIVHRYGVLLSAGTCLIAEYELFVTKRRRDGCQAEEKS